MNCNKSAHIQFASHLVVVNDTSYICTFLQYTADLSWIKHNQASWMGLGSFLECFKRRPQWDYYCSEKRGKNKMPLSFSSAHLNCFLYTSFKKTA